MADQNWRDMRKNATTVLEGEFSVVIAKAEATKSSNDKDMIKCQLRIASGPFAGRVLFHNFTISPEVQFAMKRFFEDMDVLGMGDAWFEANPTAPMELIANNLVNKSAVVILENKPYNGQDREQVKKWVSSSGGGTGPSLSGLTAAALPTPTPTPVAVVTGTEPPADPF